MPANDWEQYAQQPATGGGGKWDQYAQPSQSAAPAPTSGPIPGAAPPVPEKLQQGLTTQETNQQSLREGLKGMAKGAMGTIGSVGSLVNKIPGIGQSVAPSDEVNYYQQHSQANNDDQRAGKLAEAGIEMAAPIGQGIDALPSATRAGSVFQDLAKAGSRVPVSISKASDPLLELHSLGQTGSTVPKAARQLLQRATAPGADPIMYPEARQFASKISNLSAQERMSLDPNLHRVLGNLREGLNSDVGSAMDSIGRGKDYLGAMKEYGNAKGIQDFGNKALGMAKKGAIGALGLGGAYKVGKGLFGE